MFLYKTEFKLKSKHWINSKLLSKMKKMRSIVKHVTKIQLLLKLFMRDVRWSVRNELTKMKRNNKIDYYHKCFERNKNKVSSIWEGIGSIVNISKSSRKDIKLLNDNGNTVIEPKKIVDLFSETFQK